MQINFNGWERIGIDLESILKINLNNDFYKVVFMTAINIEVLKKIIEHIPDNYVVEFDNGKNTYAIDDTVEIDVSSEKLILKKY